MPNEVMAFMTQPRSSMAIWRREAASLGADGIVGDAAASTGADEEFEDEVDDAGTQAGIVAAPGGSGVGVPAWLIVLTSASSSLGRESASATTFAFP